MGLCDAILSQGVFDQVFIDTSRSISESLFQWLKTSSYKEVKNRIDGGLSIGLPIKGIPIEFGGDFSEDEFEKWKQEIDKGNSRNFTENESLKIVSSSASKVIADAWVACIKTSVLPPVGNTNAPIIGLLCELNGTENDETIFFKARWIPNSVTDLSPTVTNLTVVGAKILDQTSFAIGDEVPFGGITIVLQRVDKQQIAVNLDTTKGSFSGRVNRQPVRPEEIQLTITVNSDEVKMRIVAPGDELDSVLKVDYSVIAFKGVVGGFGDFIDFFNLFSNDRTASFEVTLIRKKYGSEKVGGILSIFATFTWKDGTTFQRSWPSEPIPEKVTFFEQKD
jgi:hypothetical protein